VATFADHPFGLAVYGNSVYWTNYQAGTMTKADLDGSNPVLLVTSGAGYNIAIDSSGIYYTMANGSIMRRPHGGGMPVTLATGQIGPSMYLDSTYVYWANVLAAGGSIRMVAK
jgi:hypothetical protein